ncbi:MAG: thioesterase family protein [Pseudomonadota bacterium]
MNFTDILANAKPDKDGYAYAAPDQWKQGRTLYGGLTSSICLHSARLLTGEERQLRSALVSFVGPSSEYITADAAVLRSGRTATTVRSSLRSSGSVATEALLTFADCRESNIVYTPSTMPDVAAPRPDDVLDLSRAGGPAFTCNFDLIPVGGAIPMSAAPVPDIYWWARHKDVAARDTELGLLCIGDILPPAVLTMTASPARVSSMTWMIDFVGDSWETEAGWYLFRSTADAATGGLSTQHMSIWSTSGAMIAKGRQTVALFE